MIENLPIILREGAHIYDQLQVEILREHPIGCSLLTSAKETKNNQIYDIPYGVINKEAIAIVQGIFKLVNITKNHF